MARAKKAARPVSRKKPAARPRKATVTKAAKASRKAPVRRRAQAVPSAYGSLTPYLVVSPATDAIAFYVKVFGARPGMMMSGPGGVVMHGELKIGDSILMLADEQPPMGAAPQTRRTPKHLGGTSGGVMLYVKDVDAVYARAVAAGAIGVTPPADMFWGDRYSQIEDPFGHLWSIATHLQDITPRQMQKAMAAMPPPPPSDPTA